MVEFLPDLYRSAFQFFHPFLLTISSIYVMDLQFSLKHYWLKFLINKFLGFKTFSKKSSLAAIKIKYS